MLCCGFGGSVCEVWCVFVEGGGEGDVQIVIKNHFWGGRIDDIALVFKISYRLSTIGLNLVCRGRERDVKEGTSNENKPQP